jgi:C1A family cysteine protease
MSFLSREEVILEMTSNAKMVLNDLSDEEKKNLARTIESDVFLSPEEIEALGEAPAVSFQKSAHPSTVDLRKYDTKDKDQQDNGKCSAYALVSCIENKLNQKNLDADLSEWHCWNYYRQYSCASAINAISNGALICDEKFYHQYGRPLSGIDENKHATITKYRYIGNDVNAMIYALAKGSPVYLGMKTPRDMLQGKSVIHPQSQMSSGGHALAIVGYYKDERVPGGVVAILKNSWGNKTGDGGYQYLPIAHYAQRKDCYIVMWSCDEVESKKAGYVPKPKQKVCVEWKRQWFRPWVKVCSKYDYI